MRRFRNRRPRRPNYGGQRSERPEPSGLPDQEVAEPEASYLKSLVDSRATVVVVLKTGERLRGRIRYYDRDCFSLGLAGGGPKLFLRKNSVSYICEAQLPPGAPAE
jgi:sRNA-binding regulator protein Hfq